MRQSLSSARPAIMTRAGRSMFVMVAFGIAVLLIWAASPSTVSADQHSEDQAAPVEEPTASPSPEAPTEEPTDSPPPVAPVEEPTDSPPPEAPPEGPTDSHLEGPQPGDDPGEGQTHDAPVDGPEHMGPPDEPAFEGPPPGDGPPPGGHNDELRQCVIDTLGFLPSALSDLTPEQAQQVGQNCARPGEGGQDQGQHGPEIDDETRECVINVFGYMPENPEYLTQDQKIALGQECFAGEHGGDRQGPEGDPLDDATRQCIMDTLGYLPDGPEDLTQEEQIMLGQACFGGQSGPGGQDGPDQETIECIANVLGYLPSSP